MRILRSSIAFLVGVKRDGDSAGGFGLGHSEDVGELLVGDVVVNHADDGDAKFAKSKNVPRAFEEEQGVLLQ